jgi:GTPase SAR1 family protein
MKNDTIFSKSILCACALFGFSSATAMPDTLPTPKVVFLGPPRSLPGSTSERTILFRRVAGGGNSTNSDEPEESIVLLTHTCNNRTLIAQLWNTAGQSKYAPLMPHYYRNAAQYVIIVNTPKEAEHYFLQVHNVDESVKEKAIIVVNEDSVDETVRNEIQVQSNKYGLLFWPVSLSTNAGIRELCDALAERCFEQQPIDFFQRVRLEDDESQKNSCC